MLTRVLEAEVMDGEAEARDYDAMDHSAVNRAFAADFLARGPHPAGTILDVGTGTAQIPIELCRQSSTALLVAIDLSMEMLALGQGNVDQAGFADRIRLESVDASALHYRPGEFAAVISNSIIHHLPDPTPCFAGMVSVAKSGATIFVRDLLRPTDEAEVDRLVELHAVGANERQKQLFRHSLHAALTIKEVRGFVAPLGFDPDTVTQTSDRHWTWYAIVN